MKIHERWISMLTGSLCLAAVMLSASMLAKNQLSTDLFFANLGVLVFGCIGLSAHIETLFLDLQNSRSVSERREN